MQTPRKSAIVASHNRSFRPHVPGIVLFLLLAGSMEDPLVAHAPVLTQESPLVALQLDATSSDIELNFTCYP